MHDTAIFDPLPTDERLRRHDFAPAMNHFWSILTLVITTFAFSAGSRATPTQMTRDLIRHQFEIYDPDYIAHRARYGEQITQMAGRLAQAQARGLNPHCSQQLFLEAKWLHRYTAHWSDLDDKLHRIEQSLDDHDQAYAARQSPVDGLWGICHEKWFMRMSATLDGLTSLELRNEEPRYRIRASGSFNTGKRLLTRMQDLLVSDIANSGVDNRGELASLITTFSRAAFKTQLRDSLVASIDLRSSSNLGALTDAFRFFLRGAQDPATGYWGAWYLVDGIVHKSVDLSMTYHIIAYTQGKVEEWDRIIATTSAIRTQPYPHGWQHNGRYNNHNLYDVAKIYKYGWTHMSKVERQKTSELIRSILEWSLENTLDRDGGFAADPTFSDSLADEYYFGVSFFDVVGYWQPHLRFWSSSQADPAPAGTCCRIKQRLADLNLEGWAAEGAMAKLERSCGIC